MILTAHYLVKMNLMFHNPTKNFYAKSCKTQDKQHFMLNLGLVSMKSTEISDMIHLTIQFV